MEHRKAFNFLKSYYDVLNEIHKDKDKLDYLLAILDKQFKGIEPELEGISKLGYVSQRHNIDASRKGWEDKVGYEPPTLTKGGGEGDTIPPTEPPTYTYPQNDTTTTEGGMEGDTPPPYQQEQEQEKEEEEVKEQAKIEADQYWIKEDYMKYLRAGYVITSGDIKITNEEEVDEIFKALDALELPF